MPQSEQNSSLPVVLAVVSFAVSMGIFTRVLYGQPIWYPASGAAIVAYLVYSRVSKKSGNPNSKANSDKGENV